MKVSKLIEKLEKLMTQHGDIEVVSYHSTEEDAEYPFKVSFSPKGKFREKHYLKSQDYFYFDGDFIVVECR